MSPGGSTTKIPTNVKGLPSIWYLLIQLEKAHSQFLPSLALPHQKWRGKMMTHTADGERQKQVAFRLNLTHERKQQSEKSQTGSLWSVLVKRKKRETTFSYFHTFFFFFKEKGDKVPFEKFQV